MEIKRFFDELAPRLETARVLEHELDRNLARRFNVLDYLKTDELGLSRIIADLFNPEASHGQGVLFLRTFLANLEGLNKAPDWPDLDRSRLNSKVILEQIITDQRRIDVLVEIEDPNRIGKAHCLAIENKPYAHDQENQVKDYLEYLEEEYEERFLLIYLSPTGEGPSEGSVPAKLLRKEWNSRFAIMPYYRSHEELEDELNDFRLSHSLADWLGECRKNCDVERLRWFLRDAETFCQRTFGGQAMVTDSETKAVEEYVLSDPHRLRTARAVYESWPAIRDDVCRKFLERLRSRVEEKARENSTLKNFVGDRKVICGYEGENNYSNWVTLYRDCWARYEGGNDWPTNIALQNQKKGPNGWILGVASPKPKSKMTGEEQKRRECLDKRLVDKFRSGKSTDWWPWWDWVEGDKRNWDSLVPELHKECQENGGEITDYFVNTFIEIAEKAVPIINETETDNSRT